MCTESIFNFYSPSSCRFVNHLKVSLQQGLKLDFKIYTVLTLHGRRSRDRPFSGWPNRFQQAWCLHPRHTVRIARYTLERRYGEIDLQHILPAPCFSPKRISTLHLLLRTRSFTKIYCAKIFL